MAQTGNNRLGGQYMVQDRDHLSEIDQNTDQATRKVEQVDQSQSETRQQGDDRNNDRRRQAH